MIKFHIDLKVNGQYGMNKQYAGQHWAKRKKKTDEIHQLVLYSLLQQKVKRKIFKKPVEILFRYNSRLDIDNHGVLSKMIIDGMKGYLIEDDSRKYVTRIIQEFYDGEGIEVEIKEI